MSVNNMARCGNVQPAHRALYCMSVWKYVYIDKYFFPKFHVLDRGVSSFEIKGIKPLKSILENKQRINYPQFTDNPLMQRSQGSTELFTPELLCALKPQSWAAIHAPLGIVNDLQQASFSAYCNGLEWSSPTQKYQVCDWNLAQATCLSTSPSGIQCKSYYKRLQKFGIVAEPFSPAKVHIRAGCCQNCFLWPDRRVQWMKSQNSISTAKELTQKLSKAFWDSCKKLKD